MAHTPDEVMLAPNGGLPTANYPKAELVKFIRATPAREAADDLLEALEPFASATIMTDGSIVGMERWFFEQARAAIAKAKGIN